MKDKVSEAKMRAVKGYLEEHTLDSIGQIFEGAQGLSKINAKVDREDLLTITLSIKVDLDDAFDSLFPGDI